MLRQFESIFSLSKVPARVYGWGTALPPDRYQMNLPSCNTFLRILFRKTFRLSRPQSLRPLCVSSRPNKSSFAAPKPYAILEKLAVLIRRLAAPSFRPSQPAEFSLCSSVPTKINLIPNHPMVPRDRIPAPLQRMTHIGRHSKQSHW